MIVKQQKTVVTACDHRFFWGALILGLSLRIHKIDCDFHVLGYDLPPMDIEILTKIPRTKVFSADKTKMNVCTQKPNAIQTADSDIICWMDSDCMVTGDINKYLTCPNGNMQIRFRGTNENMSVYRNYYQHGDSLSGIPLQVLKEWRSDVGDLDESQISTVSQTNCFVLNREHLPFIKLWQYQMLKVLPSDLTNVYSKYSIAYSMTDESVINSLLAFSSSAPVISEFLLDKDPNAYVAHFGLYPKPWQHWTVQSLQYYDQIQNLFKWATGNNISLPELPESFRSENKTKEVLMAHLNHAYRNGRYRLSSWIRSKLRYIR